MALIVLQPDGGGESVLGVHATALERQLDTYRRELGETLAKAMVIVEPHGGGGMAAHTRFLLTGTGGIRVGVFGLPYARAQDRGAYIVAKGWDPRAGSAGEGKPRALTIHGGGGIGFARYVRLKGTHYFEKAIAAVPTIVDHEYQQHFGELPR